ncbi:MAG TPA: GAF domain-containing protein [Actinomycetota bacterium]|jgi:GAF domain-containing protein|nr:GAF domain-containing protein [Actinomycetota bacterium]
MASTPPLARPGPEEGTAGGRVLGQPLARRRSRLRTWLLLEAGAVALGYAVAVLRDGAPATGGTWALVAAGAVAVAVPLWVKSRRELRQETDTRSAETLAIETDAKLRLIVGDVVTPIAEVVGRVHQTSGKGERESLRGQLKQLVVEAAANLCDGERARAVFFQLERSEMRAAAWFGRGDPPTTVFTDDPGDRRGQEALLLVRFHDYLLVDDVRADELPRGAEPRPGASYQSFISVAVFCGEQNLGMLSVDAPEPHAFDDTDLNVMRAMAQLLGAGLVDHR